MNRGFHTISPDWSLRRMIPWFGFLAGPIAWFLELEVVYALVPWACRSHGRFLLHLALLACLAVVALGGWSAWICWEAAGRQWPSGGDEGPIARERFLGTLGLMASALFALVILCHWIAVIFLDPCPA